MLAAVARPAAAQVTGSISGPISTPPPRAPSSQAPPPSAGGQQIPTTSPFFGSLPQGPPTAEPLSLSVKDAVDRALKNNLGLLLQEESVSAARGARWRALAELLPNVSSGVSERRQVINLKAFGFPADPSIVGPFNVFDARAFLSQPLLDVSALNNTRAATLNQQAEKYGIKKFDISSASFKFIGSKGTTFNGNLGTMGSFSCLPDDQVFPQNGVGPAEKATGKVVLDLPEKSGVLVFKDLFGQASWEYKF